MFLSHFSANFSSLVMVLDEITKVSTGSAVVSTT